MNINRFCVIGIILIGGFFISPFLVFAKDTCYVDQKASGGGDGSEDNPYKTITKALDKACQSIKIAEGDYNESINLNKATELRGDSRDGVVIKGSVSLQDNCELNKLTVSGGGITVEAGADVKIDNIKVQGARFGIETIRGGELIISDSILTKNRKGFYLQKGANTKITNCEVVENSEEGIDIRADVSGNIYKNKINNNGESGIEVILGKPKLNIYNNELKKNSSSGIAVQYYEESNNLGNVKIRDNIITNNNNYGIDCKVPSGGEGKPSGYWEASTDMTSNKISGNGKKNFASGCKFKEETMVSATMTKEEREALQLALEEKERARKISLAEKKKLEEIKLEEEKEEKEAEEIAKKDLAIKLSTDVLYGEWEATQNKDDLKIQEVKNRSSFLFFLLGPDYKKLKELSRDITVYDESVMQLKDRNKDIIDNDISAEVDDRVALIQEKRDNLAIFVENQKEVSSVLGWLLKKIYLT